MLNTYERHGQTKLIAVIVSVLVVAGIVVVVDHINSKNPAAATILSSKPQGASNSSASGVRTDSSSNATVPATSGESLSTGTTDFTDGTYTSASSYFVPSGDENIQVKLTLKGGTITDASVQNSEGDPTSAQFQQDFASQYKSYVVGQKIDSLRLSVIAGASDTTQAFSSAVNQIANKAKA